MSHVLLHVAELHAWKKAVCVGSRPVVPLGTVTSIGEMAPILAIDCFLFDSTICATRGRHAAKRNRH